MSVDFFNGLPHKFFDDVLTLQLNSIQRCSGILKCRQDFFDTEVRTRLACETKREWLDLDLFDVLCKML